MKPKPIKLRRPSNQGEVVPHPFEDGRIPIDVRLLEDRPILNRPEQGFSVFQRKLTWELYGIVRQA